MVPWANSAPACASILDHDANGNTVEHRELTGPPIIRSPPRDQILQPGSTVRLGVVAGGAGALRYQWRVGGSALAGATGDTLAIPAGNPIAGGDKRYDVEVRNAFGSVVSAAATVWVDQDSDGLPDSWEVAKLGGLGATGDFDTDQDGVSNREEFEDGTDPGSPTSRMWRLRADASPLWYVRDSGDWLATVEMGGGVANGRVAVSPSSAAGRYPKGSVVRLSAVPDPGWAFVRWEGDYPSRLSEISLRMDRDWRVWPVFEALTPLESGGGGSGLTWETGGAAPWRGVKDDGAPEGGGLVRSGGIGAGQESWIEATVTGPGTVSWWWKAICELGDVWRPGDRLVCELDGVLVHSISGDAYRARAGLPRVAGITQLVSLDEWEAASVVVGSGPHKVRWVYRKDESDPDLGPPRADVAFLDRVRFVAGLPGEMGTGVDTGPGVAWSAAGPAPWVRVTTGAHDGVDAVMVSEVDPLQEAWMESRFMGPGTVSFWWKVLRSGSATALLEMDRLELLVDGSPVLFRWGDEGWGLAEVPLDGRDHVLRWRYVKMEAGIEGQDAALVDEVRFVPAPSLAVAVDADARAFTTGVEEPWRPLGVGVLSKDGVDHAMSGVVGAGGESWLETLVSGPAMVSFQAWVPVGSAEDRLEVRVGDAPLGFVSKGEGWRAGALALPAGQNRVRWAYREDRLAGDQAGYARLDQVVPIAGVHPVADAVDAPDRLFLMGGDGGGWVRQTTVIRDGVDAAQAGPFPLARQRATLSTRIQGPGDLSYWVRTSCAQVSTDQQGLRLLVDGRVVEQVSGEIPWIERTWRVPPGEFLVEWDFDRPTSSRGSNSVWIDAIRFTPAPAETLAAGLDGAGLAWRTGGDAGWEGFRSLWAIDGGDVAAAGRMVQGGISWLETEVEGPGTVRFDWMAATLGLSQGSYAEFLIDGASVFMEGGRTDWRSWVATVPSGVHTLTWRHVSRPQASGVAAGDTVNLDRVSYVRGAGGLGDAVDQPQWLWRSGGDAVWSRQTGVWHDGADAAQSGAMGDARTSWMEVSIPGPGTLSFWWRLSAASGDVLNVYRNGVRVGVYSGTDWVRMTVPIGTGAAQTVRWEYSKNASGSAGSDAAWVDEVIFTPSAGEGLATALELPETTAFEVGGSGAWVSQTVTTHDGVDAAGAPAVPDGGMAWTSTRVRGPGVLTLWYRVSSETNRDFLRINVDGVAAVQASGEVPWRLLEMPISPGEHLLDWSYSKSFSGTGGQDRAWLDEIRVRPAVGLAAALDTGSAVETSGAVPWSGELIASQSSDGVDRACSGWLGAGQDSWMESRVSESGTISFRWMVEAAGSGDFLKAEVDGIEVFRVAGVTGWKSQAIAVGAGDHRIRWTFQRASSGGGLGRASVDQFVFAPSTVAPLVDGVDSVVAAQWRSWGASLWSRQTVGAQDGVDALRSDDPGDGGFSALGMSVDGPATVSFWWKVSSEAGRDFLGVLVEGEALSRAEISGEVPWSRQAVYLAEGRHRLVWLYSKNSSGKAGADAGWVDGVVVTPSPTLAAALDAVQVFGTGGKGWTGYVDGTNDWAVAGGVAPGETSWLETQVTGPGTAHFNTWTRSGVQDGLHLELDGAFVGGVGGGDSKWWSNQVSLPAGLHRLRWAHASTAPPADPAVRPRIDAFRFVPGAVPELNAGLDVTGQVFQTFGRATWGRDTGVRRDGEDSLRSGAAADSEWSLLRTRVVGPGALSFWTKVSSQSGRDGLTVYLNGTSGRIVEMSGERDWQQTRVYLDERSHVIEWMFARDGSGGAGANAAWLDAFEFVPERRVELGEAADQPGWEWRSGPEGGPWRGVTTALAGDGVDACLASGEVGTVRWLETTVSGPSTLRFRWRTQTAMAMGLFVDGIVQAGQISGEQPWTDAEVSIPAGLHTVRWQAFRQGALPGGGGVGAWLDAVRLEGGGFDSWAALAGLKGADALPLADPDRDGRPNLLEYAFNLDPRSAVILPGGGATGRPPAGKIAGTGSNARLVLEYLRRKSGGITYTPVFGDDLRSWTTAVGSLTTSDLGGDWELVTVVDSVSLGSQGQRFGAVQVSLP